MEKRTLLAGAALAGFIMMQGDTAKADVNMLITTERQSSVSEMVTTDMDFGTIQLNPNGDNDHQVEGPI